MTIFALLAAFMVLAAVAMGNWSKQINPNGIAQTPVAQVPDIPDTSAHSSETRDAFSFGASLDLLAMALLYCCIAFGLPIQAKSKRRPANRFIYRFAGLALVGFALSYFVDDYFC